MTRFLGSLLTGFFALTAAGCFGGPATVATITFDPSRIASEAMAMYDTNKDGKLDATELKKCPALAHSLADLDTNNDKCIQADEIAAQITAYSASGTRLRGERPRVLRGGRPIPGVTVTLEPEKFMGGTVKSATGVSNEFGDVILQTEGQPFEGVQIGFYQIVVSQKDPSGKELIPAKFNNPTTLGAEIAPSNRPNLVIDLDK